MQDIGHPMQAEMIDAAELGSPAVPSPDVGTSKKEPVEDPMECQKDQEDDKKNPMECQKDQGEDTNAPMDCEDSQTSLPEISPTKSDREALELVLHKNVDVDWPVKETFAGRHKNKNQAAGELWVLRRNMFYTYVPKMHWNEKNERLFCSLADADKTTVEVITAFKRQLGYY